MDSQENYFGSIGRQKKIIILSFRVDVSKNKNIDHWVKETIDHRVKETCDIMST